MNRDTFKFHPIESFAYLLLRQSMKKPEIARAWKMNLAAVLTSAGQDGEKGAAEIMKWIFKVRA